MSVQRIGSGFRCPASPLMSSNSNIWDRLRLTPEVGLPQSRRLLTSSRPSESLVLFLRFLVENEAKMASLTKDRRATGFAISILLEAIGDDSEMGEESIRWLELVKARHSQSDLATGIGLMKDAEFQEALKGVIQWVYRLHGVLSYFNSSALLRGTEVAYQHLYAYLDGFISAFEPLGAEEREALIRRRHRWEQRQQDV